MEQRHWRVALRLSGARRPVGEVDAAMSRLAGERPFLLDERHGADFVELRYWEQAETLEDACAMALRIWGEHRTSAELPPWEVVGLEVAEAGRQDVPGLPQPREENAVVVDLAERRASAPAREE